MTGRVKAVSNASLARVVENEDIAPNLPFPHSLDWKRLALFGGGLSCAFVQHSNQTVAWLRQLLDPAHEVSGL